jgi:putative transposase
MLTHKAFRYRAYLTPAQVARADRWSDALRFLWNLALEQHHIGHARCLDERRYPTAFDQSYEVTQLRAELPWLADVPRNMCDKALADLDKAWQRCFLKINKAPRWKRKGVDAFNLHAFDPALWRLKGNLLRFTKLGELRVVVHRPLEGKPKSCTLVREGDQWFASIICEVTIPDPTPRAEPIVAIDRGIINFAATSDGELIPNPRFLKDALKKLRRLQRSVSRRKKGSKNQAKAQHQVMKQHRKVRRQRAHFHHEQSAQIVKSHGVIVLERLNVIKMLGGNCSSGISDAGWSSYEQMISYKAKWSGGSLRLVPAQYSSQECCLCGHIDAKSRRGEVFRCTKCGHVEHADINAAKVLLRRANRSVLPVEGSLLEGSQRNRKVKSKLCVRRRRWPSQDPQSKD